MVAWLVGRLGLTLAPRSLRLGNGGRLEIDAASDEPPVLCTAWVHRDDLRPVEQARLISEAFKLIAARRLLGDHYRLILLVCCEQVARHLRAQRTWHLPALTAEGIEVIAADLTRDNASHVPTPQVSLTTTSESLPPTPLRADEDLGEVGWTSATVLPSNRQRARPTTDDPGNRPAVMF
jgi:hypothetical protein